MSTFDIGLAILGVVIVLYAALTFGMRLRAERLRLKLLKTQEAEQPLRRAVLDAQVAALKSEPAPTDEDEALPLAASLLRRAPVAPNLPPSESDLYWDSLLQFADMQ